MRLFVFKKFSLVFVLILSFFLIAGVAHAATKEYNVPDTSFQAGPIAQIPAKDAKTYTLDPITLVVSDKTVNFDVNLGYAVVKRINPIRLGAYWQFSDIYETWFRSHYNGAKVYSDDVQKTSLLIIPYSEDWLQVGSTGRFPERSLKIACSPNGGKSWTMERTSYVHTRENTVSARVKIGGGCMIMAGFVPVTQYNNYRARSGSQ